MRICIVSTTIYPVLAGDTAIQQVGGAEVQQVQLARLFRSMGHEVSFVTLDHGQADAVVVDGFTVYKAYSPTAGLPGLRFVHPRWTGLWSALAHADADLYYTRGAGMLPGLLSFFRRGRSCRVVHAAASDTDFDAERMLVRYARDRWLYRHGLARADAVIVQSDAQRAMLQTIFGRSSWLIPNFFDAEPKELPIENRRYVLWVGKIRQLKRPMLFVDLARSLPHLDFAMIGPMDPHERRLFEQVEADARSVANLQFLGFRPLNETESWFDKCSVLVSTSEVEGFPNVFLQAMRRGIPIVSFVDPDSLIRDNDLGRVVENEAELVAAVSDLAVPPFRPARPIMDCFEAKLSRAAVEGAYRKLFASIEA